jgi:hypothetical protein
MEQERARMLQKVNAMKPQDKVLQALKHPFVNRWRNVAPEKSLNQDQQPKDNLLDALVFIPSSDACTYKEKITARGDGKARLRGMR